MKLASFALAFAVLAPGLAQAAEWRIVGAPGETVFAVTTLAVPEKNVAWSLRCEADSVAIIQTGVTDLMDTQTGAQVPDSGSEMPAGAAYMGLLVDGANSDLRPAETTPNPSKGWDMLIRLPKDDRTLGKLRKTKMLALMTTGYTAAVVIEADARKMIGDFLGRCSEI